MPMGQARSDTIKTLERDGLIRCEFGKGKHIRAIIIYDPTNVRVLCWQLTENSVWRQRGHREDVFPDLPVDLVDQAPSEMLH